MARRSEHSFDEIKAMIFKAAESIVDESGFSQLKVRNIAMEIGYTVGSFYMVFDNLATFIVQLKARTLDNLIEHIAAVPAHNQPEQCLLNIAQAYLNFTRNHFNRWQMLFDYHLNIDIELPDWYVEKLASLFTPLEIQFKRLSDADIEDPKASAQAFLCSIHGICNMLVPLYRQDQPSIDIDQMIKLTAENFIRGSLTKSK